MAVAAMTMKVPMAAAVPKVSCDMFSPSPVLTQWVLGERQLSYGRRWALSLARCRVNSIHPCGFRARLIVAEVHVLCTRDVPRVDVVMRYRVTGMAVRLVPEVDVVDFISRQWLELVIPTHSFCEELLIDHDFGEGRLAVVPTVDRSERKIPGVGIVVSHRWDAAEERHDVRRQARRVLRSRGHHH